MVTMVQILQSNETKKVKRLSYCSCFYELKKTKTKQNWSVIAMELRFVFPSALAPGIIHTPFILLRPQRSVGERTKQSQYSAL